VPETLVPATLRFHDGIPYSEAFGDVYHNADGGIAKKRHVFLGGNGLPARWAGRRRFVILETGFGLGLNFLVTLQAWRRDPARGERLHFVSIEKYPFSLQDLRTLHARYPELEEEAAELHARWPLVVPGAHRLEFGNVVLTLHLGDIKVLRDLRLAADAIYLDGFSPAKNADMWSPAAFRAISRLAAPGATAATWSVAGLFQRVPHRLRQQEGDAGRQEHENWSNFPRSAGAQSRRGRRRPGGRRGVRAPLRARLGSRPVRAPRRAGTGSFGQPCRHLPSDRDFG